MTLLIIDPWQYCVCCIRSGVTRCTLLMVLYLDHIDSSAGYHQYTYVPPHCRTSQYHRTFISLSVSSGTTLLSPYLMVWWDWRVSRAGPIFFFIGLSCSFPTLVFYYFPFLFFLSLGWYCGAGVFRLIRCIHITLSALQC